MSRTGIDVQNMLNIRYSAFNWTLSKVIVNWFCVIDDKRGVFSAFLEIYELKRTRIKIIILESFRKPVTATASDLEIYFLASML